MMILNLAMSVIHKDWFPDLDPDQALDQISDQDSDPDPALGDGKDPDLD